MGLANLEWFKKSDNKIKEMKQCKKIVIKKHQKRYTYTTYQGTFLKQLLKKTFKPNKENPNMEENLC